MYAEKTMVPVMLVLLALICPALAHGETRDTPCSGTMSTGFERGYVYPHYGIDVAPGAPVVQLKVALTCGHITAHWQGTSELSTNSTYGHRGLADEQRVGLTYHNLTPTPLGDFTYEVSATYLGLDMGQGVGVSRDDYVELTVLLARPITRGTWKVTPSLRLVKDIPVAHNNPLYWGEGGLRVEGPFARDSRFYVDGVLVHNVNSTTAVPHKNVWYGEAGVSTPVNARLTTVMGVRFTQYGARDSRSFLVIERDGRLVQHPRMGPKPTNHPNLNPFFQFIYSF